MHLLPSHTLSDVDSLEEFAEMEHWTLLSDDLHRLRPGRVHGYDYLSVLTSTSSVRLYSSADEMYRTQQDVDTHRHSDRYVSAKSDYFSEMSC